MIKTKHSWVYKRLLLFFNIVARRFEKHDEVDMNKESVMI
jgi:hypothetical protein